MLFLGAGASAPFGIPTTPTLTKEIEELLNSKSQSLFEQIKLYHNDVWHREPNYEEILGYLAAYAYPADLRSSDYWHIFANQNPKFRNEQTISGLIDEIHMIVCDHCNQPFMKGKPKYLTSTDLESKFQMTYDAILGTYLFHEQSPIVFTTNYDPSLELWCQKRNIECVDGSLKTENLEVKIMKDEIGQRHDVEQETSKGYHVGLVRLHGSIWTYDIRENLRIKFTTPPELRMFSDLYQEAIRSKPCLIFPGQEEKVSRGQSNVLYQYFRESLKGNCLFIGFSFRHDIFKNPIIDRFRSGNIRRLGVLSPHAETLVAELFKDEKGHLGERVVPIQAELGTRDAVDQLAQKWFPTVGIGVTSGYQVLEEVREWRTVREQSYIK